MALWEESSPGAQDGASKLGYIQTNAEVSRLYLSPILVPIFVPALVSATESPPDSRHVCLVPSPAARFEKPG